MARPERNNVDYFPFLCKEGKAMYFIDKKYGNDGYATWVRILRELAVTNNHFLQLGQQVDLMYLSSKCNVSTDILENILTDLSDLEEINKELWNSCKVVWSDKFIEHIHDAYKKRNNKCITLPSLRILLTGLGVLKPSKSSSEVSGNTQSKVEYTKVYKSKVEEGGDKSPTQKNIEERERDFKELLRPFVQEFSKETVQAFFDYWTEKSSGARKMRFEKQVVFEIPKRLATWKNKEKEFKENKNGFNQKSNTGNNPTIKPAATGRSFFGDRKPNASGDL